MTLHSHDPEAGYFLLSTSQNQATHCTYCCQRVAEIEACFVCIAKRVFHSANAPHDFLLRQF